MTGLAIIGVTWAAAALGLGLLVGRGIALADRAGQPADWTDEVERFLREQAAPPAARGGRA